MKKIQLIVVFTVLCCAAAAQSNADCPGFRNPTSFVTNSSQFFWSARVGERCYPQSQNDTTTGYYVMSTCADPNAPTILGNAISSSIYNSGTDMLVQQCGHNFFDANDSRFQIITSANAGIDQFTVLPGATTGMPRIPPGYQTSIRLGDMRNTGTVSHSHTWSNTTPNRGAEALYYTMFVTTQNALLFINYAVVARRYSHTAYDAGEFLIRVVGQNPDGSWQTAPLNDSLWYKVSAPNFNGAELPLGWEVGAGDVNNWPCTYAFKPWSKVAINLNNYLYQHVRIEMYTSDCIYSADPIYAYISGDFQSMSLRASGCPDPMSDVIDTLTAPSDMISYRWFVSEDGPIYSLYDTERMDTATFRQVYPATGTTTEHRYMPRLSDFVLTRGVNAGDTSVDQTFMCIMTSALDPAKPVESKLYVTVQNRRPEVDYTYENACDTTVTFHNLSYARVSSGLDHSATYWVFYSDTLCMNPIDTVWGDSVTYRFPHAGRYGVRLYCETAGDNEHGVCGAAKSFVCEAIGRPEAAFTTNRHVLCEGDYGHFSCTAGYDNESVYWIVDSVVYPAEDLTDYNRVLHIQLPLGKHVISLRTVNSAGCDNIYTDSVVVYGVPVLNMEGSHSEICLGDTVTVTASGSTTYNWMSSPEDTALASQQGNATIHVSPTRTTTYYLLPSTDNPCSDEGAMFTVNLIPRPEARIHASLPTLSVDNNTVIFTDVSPNRDYTRWLYSDGVRDSGLVVTHSFDVYEQDSVGVWMESCNNLGCCGDTLLWLPVENILVWLPNVFVPGDGARFGMVTTMPLTEYEMYIYNREGLLVYRSTDPLATWDGTDLNGRACPQGAYVYWYRYAYDNLGGYHEGHGTVTLLR